MSASICSLTGAVETWGSRMFRLLLQSSGDLTLLSLLYGHTNE